mmetsp:Transcript_29551/g.26131  ORF Transcript_29551/g.26131 Transcript_29551/m.26131 type:complete len:85 (+) Transcript_29551:267-521(+)
MTKENKDLAKEIEQLSTKIDSKFIEVKDLTSHSQKYQNEQDLLIMEVQECIDKEELRSTLIAQEIEYHEDDLKHIFPNEMNYEK